MVASRSSNSMASNRTRRAVDLDDIAQMQIAVAVAHIASPRPRLEQGDERGKPRAACAGEISRRRARQQLGVGGKFRLVVGEYALQRRHRPLGRKRPVGGGVEGFDDRGETRHRGQAEPPLAGHAVIQHSLVEPVHAQHPFHRLAVPAKPERAAFAASDRCDIEIKLRRGARIDAQLVQAGRMPLGQRRKVEKRVFDRPLHLVGEGSGQKHHRSVGSDTSYGCRRRSVRLGPSHESQHLSLQGIGRRHALP